MEAVPLMVMEGHDVGTFKELMKTDRQGCKVKVSE